MSESASNRPRWEIAREAILDAGGQCLAEVTGPNNSELRFYSLPPRGELRILQTFHGAQGGDFQIYKPVCDSSLVKDTIEAAIPRESRSYALVHEYTHGTSVRVFQ